MIEHELRGVSEVCRAALMRVLVWLGPLTPPHLVCLQMGVRVVSLWLHRRELGVRQWVRVNGFGVAESVTHERERERERGSGIVCLCH